MSRMDDYLNTIREACADVRTAATNAAIDLGTIDIPNIVSEIRSKDNSVTIKVTLEVWHHAEPMIGESNG